ncbi:MAG: NifU family protein, partial [Gemmatimonadetes bacterium]|nr:NifU family protein [Gemmatimonadota bacterium]
MATLSDLEARERVARLEARLERLEALEDAAARTAALEAVRALLELYGEALARIVERVVRSADADALADAFAGDELVAHLLLLHGLHPAALESRVRGALDEVRPHLRSHGGDVELLGIEGGVARLRLAGHCRGCPASSLTLRLAVEAAVRRAAPELERIETEGVEATPARAGA